MIYFKLKQVVFGNCTTSFGGGGGFCKTRILCNLKVNIKDIFFWGGGGGGKMYMNDRPITDVRFACTADKIEKKDNPLTTPSPLPQHVAL